MPQATGLVYDARYLEHDPGEFLIRYTKKYEYDEIGYPFLYELGQTIYSYELGRKRAYKPDLSQFRVNYEQRDPRDTRPALKEVDN